MNSKDAMSRMEFGELPGATTPVLTADLLARIHELNLDYLDLLLAEQAVGDEGGQVQQLPVRVREGLAMLSPSARRALAAMPYTLYSLGFEDEGFWRFACDPAALLVPMSVRERYAPPRGPALHGSFCELALLYAWHVATSHRLASRVVYAMPEATARRLTATPLSLLKRIAANHPGLLMPRWPTNPGFWPDLVRFAATSDESRLATAKLLGNQLIAAELELAAGGTVHSPRLRARKLQFCKV
jgi:hypothetical protein